MLDVHEPTQSSTSATPSAEEPGRVPVVQLTSRLAPRQASGLMWGIGLILFGTLTLLTLFTGWPVFQLAVVPTLAVLFLIGGIARRSFGLMVPAGILGGLSVGVILAQVFEGKLSEDAIGGLVVLSLGVGFALIVALQALFTRLAMWWPFIPAAFLVTIGVVLLVGGSTSPPLQVLGYLWPVALLIAGIWIVWRALQRGPEDRTPGPRNPR